MSDADDQMGGTGGETGGPPGTPTERGGAASGRPDESGGEAEDDDTDPVTEDSEESFPASDPPAHY